MNKLLILVSLVALSCVGGRDDPIVTKSIGTAGGSVASVDGNLTLTIPANALAADTVITVSESQPTGIAGLMTTVYDFGPDGTTFTTPVLVEIVAAGVTDALVLRNSDTLVPVADSSWNASTNTLSGSLDSFSAYAGYYHSCAAKNCGDSCTFCPPNAANCSETEEVKTCGPDRQCHSGTASCGALQYYATCGDPVCGGFTLPTGATVCSNEAEGSACTTAGDTCAIDQDGCNRSLLCTDSDPTQNPGGCPISLRTAKRDIAYLDEGSLQGLATRVLNLKLARWSYRDAPASTRPRLGFIIEDQLHSEAVLPNGRQVDLYGYTSMAIAAVQTQARQIDALRQENRELKARLDALDRKISALDR